MIPPRTIIEPEGANSRYWAELWHYRELMGFMAWRDIKVRYRQALLGAGWALIQPLLHTVLLTFVFSKLAKLPAGDVPYPLVVMAGLLPWQFFTAAFSGTSASLPANAHLLTKTYFPRLVIPLSTMAVAVIDLALMLLIAIPLCLAFAEAPAWRLLLLPLFAANAGLIALGCGLLFSAFSIRRRDLRFLLPFILQLGMFATPIGYRTEVLGDWQPLMALNPLTAPIEGFRWCLLGGDLRLDFVALGSSLLLVALLLFTGLASFRRAERHLADTL